MKKRVKIYHNRNIFFIVLALVIAVLLFIVFNGDNREQNNKNECFNDSDCVPASCCHPSSCVPISQTPDCSAIFCTAVCQPETLDCGQGNCQCVNGKCSSVFR